ncbi:MAG: MbcA/ParS/Xre antitoxin family protein [Planctomycetota bacterium]
MLESRLYRETLAAAQAFHARKLWREFEEDDCFAVVVPGEEHPLFAAVMGQAGEEFGLLMFRGPHACSCLMEVLYRDPEDQGAPDETALISFSMGRYGETPSFGRSFLAKARFAGRRDDIVPCFLVVDPGRQPRAPTRDEAETLLYALKGILKAWDAGILEPQPIWPDYEALTLILDGDPRDPDVSKEVRPCGAAPLGTDSAGLHMAVDLSDLPRLSSRWLIGFPKLPVTIEGDDRVVRGVLVVDEDSELIVTAEPVQGGTGDAVSVVIGAFHGENAQSTRGVPEGVLVANRELFNALFPILNAAGVQCRYEPAIPLLDEISGGLMDRLGEPEGFAADPDTVPAPNDLDGWKACDRRLYGRARACLVRQGNIPDRAVRRYFGDVELADDLLDDSDDLFPAICFYEWLWLDHKPADGSWAVAEKLLAEDLPRAQRLLLEARLKATPSIFRVQSIERGVSLDLVDVLFGGEVTLHDEALSQSAAVDLSFAARVFPAGDFHFIAPLGPPLSGFEVDEAIEWLEECGMELTPEGVKAKTHLFGRLWDWVEAGRAEQGPPHVTNMDGDELHFHTATYRVEDEAAARSAIAARDDIEWDEEDDRYVWERRQGGEPGAVIGDSLTLGSLRFVGDELLVEVNSDERLEKARAWLDPIPGIRFQGVRSRTVEDLRREAFSDDEPVREEVPMTPELAARLQEMMREHYMQWLDMPVPALGGKTPREMCSTEEGKQRVARMIRTIPRPMGPAGAAMDVPRQEMLEALGLDAEDRPRP